MLYAYSNAEKYNGDSERIAVVGDSAGGDLATAVALKARDLDGPKLIAQALLYPLTTFQELPLPSRYIYDSGYYLLSRHVMYLARDLYTPEEEMWLSPYTSPLNAESLENLPKTLVITAQYDPLKDEGEEYANRLQQSGVEVTHLHYEGVMHGFISFYEVMHLGEHGLRETSTFLKEAFADGQKLNVEHDATNVELATVVISSVDKKSEIYEYLEAYAIAAFLIVKDTFSRS